MADPRHEYIAGKVRGCNARVAAFDAASDERPGRFASPPVADASPRAFPARFRYQMRLSVVPPSARDRHRPRRDRPSPRDFETDLRDPQSPVAPTDRSRSRSAYRRRKPSRAYSASPREPSRCPLRRSVDRLASTPNVPLAFFLAFAPPRRARLLSADARLDLGATTFATPQDARRGGASVLRAGRPEDAPLLLPVGSRRRAAEVDVFGFDRRGDARLMMRTTSTSRPRSNKGWRRCNRSMWSRRCSGRRGPCL